MPTWDEFRQRPRSGQQQQSDPDFDDICALALTAPAGRQLIEALRARYIDAAENPHALESAMRVRVTQQQFVRDLEAARDRGLDAAKQRSEAAAKNS